MSDDPVMQPAEPAPPAVGRVEAAGVMFVVDGRVLLLQRGPGGDAAGTWSFPGGKLEAGEDERAAAARECAEEMAAEVDPATLKPFDRSDDGMVRFTTFSAKPDARFAPTLNEEHTGYQWAPAAGPWPEPMHPGAAATLSKLVATELDVARAIAAGLLPSPTRFHNVTLFALRLFGTGVAWRERKGEREYTYRSPSIYVNEEFLQRCNGLPVILEHPEGLTLDSDEFKERVIGSIMLPYVSGDAEVWGVARVYDDAAIRMMTDVQLSTSPTVEYTHGGLNERVDVEGGNVLLIENVPSLLDHVAICVEGVWDRGGPPTGVRSVGVSGSAAMADDASFEESDHPRDDDGKFTSSGTAPSKSLLATEIGRDGRRVLAGGAPLPNHVAKLKLPPAWTDVRVSTDPKAALQAQGRDAKGRVQSVYSMEHSQAQAAAKFSRVKALAQEYEDLERQNEEARASKDTAEKDTADCLALIMKMGVRPGSDDDTGADKKAYGASTLKGEHVVTEGDATYLRFTGKKGVSLNLMVSDPDLVDMLRSRASASGPDGSLFPNTNDKRLLAQSHSLDDGKFKTKDFRTHVGTRRAADLVKSLPVPKSEADYKRAVRRVASEVASVLGNTPVVALQSYISPTVFSEWAMR